MDKDDIRKLIQEEMSKKSKGDNEESEKEHDSKVEAVKTAEQIGEEFADSVINAITEKLSLNDKDKAEARSKYIETDLKAVRYPAPDEVKGMNDDEKIVLFFKSLMNRRNSYEADQLYKALVEGTAADGGNLVPAPLATRVFEILPDLSVMRRIATILPMTADTLQVNALNARPVAYWTGEYVSKTTTSAEFAQVTLTAQKLVCLLPASHELIQDANIDVVQYVIRIFGDAIAQAEDRAFFTGTGTGQPTGIQTSTVTTQSAGASLDFDDVIDLIDLVPQSVAQQPNAAFVCNKAVVRLLRKIKDTNGDYIWRQGLGVHSGQIERLPDTVYGYPVYEQNDLSEDLLYFGDWSKYLIGDRQQITVSTTDEGGDAWRRDATEIKAVERVAGIAVQTGAFARLNNV